ncbi:MAG TPA: nucleoside recognition domain-containing protein [Chthoniobacterales bacterium]|nr:nucleoside recognition domain-containing protein [Chthoniobacterales bacterium]
MLNLVWVALLLTGVVCAAFTGRFDALNQGALNAAKSAVMEIALPLIGVMALWLGMMRLAESAGLIQLLGRLIRPIMSRLFPEIPANHPAMGAMMMNIAANMLGVSNAATPLGLKAMAHLNDLNPKKGVATNAMCTFLALNTSSIQLVPATAINILAINGSKNPTAIVASTLIATGVATVAAIFFVKVLERTGPFRWESQPDVVSAQDAPGESSKDSSAPGLATPRLRPWAILVIGTLVALFAVTLVVRAFPYVLDDWFPIPHPSAGWPAGFLDAVAMFLRALSPLAIPFLLAFFPLYALGKGISVYSEFVEGAKEGFQIAIRIVPYLVGMLVAIAVFRESGALDLLKSGLAPLLNAAQIPTDLLPMIVMRPLSGSGSIAILGDLVKQFGPDHLLSYMAATIYGSAETTFYVVAVYFGSVGITRTRHSIPAGLLADLVGVIAAVAVCRWLFG